MTEKSDAQPEKAMPGEQGRLASLSRRGFLGTATIGAAAAGVIGSVPGMSLVSQSDEVDPGDVSAASMAEPLVAQVRDFSTGEISVMSGLREVVIRDPQLVMRLVKSMTP